MLNQIEVRFSNFVSQFAPPSSSMALDARLKLLERQGRSAAEEVTAQIVEAQLFTDSALLERAKDRLSSKPSRLARHICASLLTVAVVAGLGSPAHADEHASPDPAATSQQDNGTEDGSLLDLIEELIGEPLGWLTGGDDKDPTDGTG